MDLEDFVHGCQGAWQVFVTGDPGPVMLLFSHRDDVTLDAAAARFRNGHLAAFDILTKFVSDDLACYHEIERGEAMLGGRSELEPLALRVTSTYRHEDGQWRIVLRQADPIVAPRPTDATLGG